MNERASVASITVSYNSIGTLRVQLDALLKQTHPLDEIIVIDNCSHDSTLVTLKGEYPHVTVIALPRNEGISGALGAGLSYAMHAKRYDWAWLFDQDSIPQSDALEKLIEGLGMIADGGSPVGMVCSLPVAEDGKTYPGLLWRERFMAPSKGCQTAPFWMIDATISSGSMIRREVTSSVGLPRLDFFIDFVDFEYCLRVRKHGYRIVMVRDSVLRHTIGTPRSIQLLGISRTWSDHMPWREYYYSRNFTYLVWHMLPGIKSKFFLVVRQLRHALAILLHSGRPMEGIRMLVRGFLDGRIGRLENRFLPDDSSDSPLNSGSFHAPTYRWP